MKANKSKEKKLNKDSMSQRKELIGHIIISLFLYVICFWDRIENIPKFPKNFLYLTQIDLYLNMIYYSFCLYDNIFYKEETKKKYNLFFNFCFTLSFVVFIMYWILIFYRNTSSKNNPSALLIFLLHGGLFFFNFIEQYYLNPRQNPKLIQIWYYIIFNISYLGLLIIINKFFEIRLYHFIYGTFKEFFLFSSGSIIVTIIGHVLYYYISRNNQKKNLIDIEMN